MAKHADKNNTASLLIRTGLAIVFLYAAVSSLKDPQNWTVYLPNGVTKIASAITLIKILALYELLLAGLLISGKFVRYVGILCAATFTGIVVSNLSLFSITFRDVALIFSSLALIFVED